MLVGINALHIKPGWGGGEERYLRAVLGTIRNVQPDTRILIFTEPENDASFTGCDKVCLETRLLSSAENQLGGAAKTNGCDVLFSPLRTAPAKCPVPLVIFALDLRRFEPANVRAERHGSANLRAAKRLCASAAAMVTCSEFTRRKFLELLDIPLNKVIVAPLGIGPEFVQPQEEFIQRPYLLTVGDTHAWKNVERLVAAFDLLKPEFPHNLIAVGRPGEAEPKDWGARVIRVEYCAPKHLAALYQHADVFIQPSLYEGSGITVLEAMRAGAPVATAHIGGITEVAADVPFFFNPENVSSIVTIIRWALEETGEARQRRVKYGRQMSLEFTWEKCAWKTLSAFKRA